MIEKNAIAVGEQTLLGVLGNDFPLGSGNCFSVECDDGSAYRIVNFVLENLKELLHRGLTWPVKILVLEGSTAVLHDERIHSSWYRDDFCPCCCPQTLLPLPQRLQQMRKEARGHRSRNQTADGMIYVTETGYDEAELLGAPPRKQFEPFVAYQTMGKAFGHTSGLDRLDLK